MAAWSYLKSRPAPAAAIRFTLGVLMTVAVSQTIAASENTDELRSLREERREVLLYGIDTQVLEVLDALKSEQEDALVDDVYAVFKLTSNTDIRISSLNLFSEFDYQLATEDALEILRYFGDEPNELTIAAIKYLAEIAPNSDEDLPVQRQEIRDALMPIVRYPDEAVARAAIKGLGAMGSGSDADLVEHILDLLDSSSYSASLKPELILALGELRAEKAVGMLIEIATDEDEDPTWRRYACDALGKIGSLEALPALRLAYDSDDAILRSYAVSAMGHFPTEEATSLLMEALRDSYWRTRVGAAGALGERAVEKAIPILSFKASRDPEVKVREAATRALAAIGTDDALELLVDLYVSNTTPGTVRLTALEELTEKAPGRALSPVEEVAQQEWELPKSTLLERTAHYVSLVGDPEFAPIYARFLESGNILVIVHGIRGIERSGLAEYADELERFAEEGNHKAVRRAALAALETLRPGSTPEE